MREKRITAVIMSIFMALSLLPTTVFAAAAVTLDGQLKISGTAAVGSTLSADLKEVKPEELTEDSISYVWSRKSDGDEKMKELSKEKTYTVVQEDVGAKIVLTITGLEDKGVSGSLKASTDYVTAAEKEDTPDPLSEASTEESSGDNSEEATGEKNSGESTEEMLSEEISEENTGEESAEETSGETAGNTDMQGQQDTDSIDTESDGEIPNAQVSYQENSGETDQAGTEEIGGIPVATEDGSYSVESSDAEILDETDGDSEKAGANPSENDVESVGGNPVVSFQAEAITEDNSGVIDFGTVVAGEEDKVEEQYVTVKNTGKESLNFVPISPKYFMVQDIEGSLEAGDSVKLWIVPRAGTDPGTYEETITYTTSEGAEASFTAKMTVEEAKNKENDVKADQENLNFTSTDSQKLTVTNNGSQTVELTASVLAGTITVTPSGSVTLDPGASYDFTVNPVPENLETGKTYDDKIIFEDASDGSSLLSVPVAIKLPEATATPQPEIAADSSELDFGAVTEGYSQVPASKSVTITNTGMADAKLSSSVVGKAEAQYFDTALADEMVAAQGGSTSFIVQPKNGLAAGNYEESFLIQDSSAGTEIQITAKFTVEKGTHSLSAAPDTLVFSSAKEGYGQIEAQQFTVKNNGNMVETLVQPSGTYFEISTVDAANLVLQPGDSVSFTVRPKSGLSADNYEETVKISSDNTETSLRMEFQVIKGTATLTKIQQPSAVTGLPNGTKKDAQSLKLPSTVVIETTAGNMKASVAWDVENCNYSVSSTEAQKFRVRGAVSLPGGVDNNNQITLLAYIEVSVNAYSPKKVSADANYITGIEYNGVYTTQSRISFTAVGAGMDNASPRKGDTRYVPLNWTVINTNTWAEAPYTGSFGLAKSGDYTLKVMFKLQQYDGSKWTDVNKSDTKQVPFSISKAKVTAPGLDLTPAANRRNAVKTGDNTPIMPFVIILIVAVAAIGGILVYRKRRK